MNNDHAEFIQFLKDRFQIERKKQDRSGIYAFTQRLLAYNSNKIEGSTLTQELIKQFHYELKSGVFEDRANGYAIGDYKKRPNMIGIYQTTRPENVSGEIQKLLEWYYLQAPSDLAVLAEFHARYESIHPFQF